MGDFHNTALGRLVETPADLRGLEQVGASSSSPMSFGSETIAAVSQTGGHLGAGLGVVELTTAIHYVFNRRLRTG